MGAAHRRERRDAARTAVVRGRRLSGARGQGWRRVALALAGRAADPPRTGVIKASAPTWTRAQITEALANAKGRRAVRPGVDEHADAARGSPPIFACADTVRVTAYVEGPTARLRAAPAAGLPPAAALAALADHLAGSFTGVRAAPPRPGGPGDRHDPHPRQAAAAKKSVAVEGRRVGQWAHDHVSHPAHRPDRAGRDAR
ncbi:hypothetical protein [Streptomyces sp. NPDC018584]|uniref:hypothetical protein n=1 Tax=unclassified Streptomyces TaxID=2593676 RepID=UPI00378E71D5